MRIVIARCVASLKSANNHDRVRRAARRAAGVRALRVTRHSGYSVSQCCRKRIEEVFGWIKSSAGLAKVKLRGRDRVDAAFTLALAAYNLIRLPKLLAASA
jgi:hypothetical protein